MYDNVFDSVLHQWFDHPMVIRVEVQVKDAPKMFETIGPDVAEIYSPPRVAHDAGVRTYLGVQLRPGWSLDLTMTDPKTGEAWDFSKPEMSERATELVINGKPFMLVCSPVCTPFSSLQGVNTAIHEGSEGC